MRIEGVSNRLGSWSKYETADPLMQYHTTGEGTGFPKTEQFPPGVREPETLNFISTS